MPKRRTIVNQNATLTRVLLLIPHVNSTAKPKSEMNEEELRRLEEEEFNTGPLSVLQQSVKNHTQILISCRNNKKLLARVKAFDRHCNMVLENVKEVCIKLRRLFVRQLCVMNSWKSSWKLIAVFLFCS